MCYLESVICIDGREWQRRMFLQQEPAIPEEIKDLLVSEADFSLDCQSWLHGYRSYNVRSSKPINRGLRQNAQTSNRNPIQGNLLTRTKPMSRNKHHPEPPEIVIIEDDAQEIRLLKLILRELWLPSGRNLHRSSPFTFEQQGAIMAAITAGQSGTFFLTATAADNSTVALASPATLTADDTNVIIAPDATDAAGLTFTVTVPASDTATTFNLSASASATSNTQPTAQTVTATLAVTISPATVPVTLLSRSTRSNKVRGGWLGELPAAYCSQRFCGMDPLKLKGRDMRSVDHIRPAAIHFRRFRMIIRIDSRRRLLILCLMILDAALWILPWALTVTR